MAMLSVMKQSPLPLSAKVALHATCRISHLGKNLRLFIQIIHVEQKLSGNGNLEYDTMSLSNTLCVNSFENPKIIDQPKAFQGNSKDKADSSL